MNPEVAERRTWAKFGLEKGKSKGPQPDTTSVGENIVFRPSRDWKAVQAAEAKEGGGKAEEKSLKEQLRDKKVKCRICQGEHFTARCPYKDTMAPVGDDAPALDPMAEDGEDSAPTKSGGLGAGSGGYVPPHLRKGASAGAGERMGGKYERDDLATLRVTNVSWTSTDDGASGLTVSRYLRWQRNRNLEIYSSALEGSRGYFWPKIEILGVPKALPLFHTLTAVRLRERVRNWTGMVTST